MENNNPKNIFISYSRYDKKQVFKLKDEIDKVIGTTACWIDLTDIETDEWFIDVIIDAINQAEIFLFMYSGNSEKSKWTRKEFEYAQHKGKRIVFVRLADVALNDYYLFQFGSHDIVNINDNDEKNKLLANLKSWINPGEVDLPVPEVHTSDMAEKVMAFLRKKKWHIVATVAFGTAGFFSTGLLNGETANESFENNIVLTDTASMDDTVDMDTIADEKQDGYKDISGKDSTAIMQSMLQDYMSRTDSICKLAQNQNGNKKIIPTLRDANYFYYYQANYLTKRLYGKKIERNLELDKLVGREYRYWIEKAEEQGSSKKNYVRKKECYENAYRLRESNNLKAYIDWLDQQINKK